MGKAQTRLHLALETSGIRGSVAIVRGHGEVLEAKMGEALCHARDLLVLAEALLKEGGLRVGDLTSVGVSMGPGSYTGMRVGMAAAKVLAWTLSIPLVGVESLHVLARGVPDEHSVVAAAVDAKRGAVFYALYERCGADLVEVIPTGLAEAGTAVRQVPAGAAVVGSGARVLAAASEKELIMLGEEFQDPRGGVLAEVALEKLARGETSDPFEISPCYLRRSEAEELWDKRHGRS